MPLLSVIVPTHNRAKYALPTVRSLLALSERIEVVVSDTSSDDVLQDAIAQLPAAHRVNLVRPPTGVSVVDNFNAALAAATGDYLVFIGDDDLVTSAAIHIAEWAKRTGVDAVSVAFPANYYWPDFQHRLRGDFYAGTLRIDDFSGCISEHDAQRALTDAAESLGNGVMTMPRAYAGMISLELANRIRQRHGELFGGVSPDIYSAALISSECRRCMRIDYPIVVPGNSGASTSGQSASGGHLGGLRDNAHIGAFKNLVWDELIPEFYSVPTVWGFSLLKALEKLGRQESANLANLYVRALLFHRHYAAFTKASIRTWAHQRGWLHVVPRMLAAAAGEAGWVFRKVFSMARVTASGKAPPQLSGLADTVEASVRIEALLQEHAATRQLLQRLSA